MRITDLPSIAAAWLQSVLLQLPTTIHAVYVEYGDAFTPNMEHLVYFNAFGFVSLADGQFDPTNAAHIGELGEFAWEPADECRFRACDHPNTDWLAVLRTAALSLKVLELVAELGIQLVIGEHDGEVCVIR